MNGLLFLHVILFDIDTVYMYTNCILYIFIQFHTFLIYTNITYEREDHCCKNKLLVTEKATLF